MLDQENLYQLILNEQWTDILNLLYSHKKEITSNTLLQKAAAIFEEEFFKRVAEYAFNRKDIEDNLDTLYILNHGKFYQLSSPHYKILIIELVKRKPLKEAVNYAKFFPDEKICKARISKFEIQKAKERDFKLTDPKIISMNWIEIYNRLFELINVQGDTATYYSGPRFIDTVREFDPYFPDYNQFLNKRNQEGKSTSRKIFFYDILLGLKEDLRIKIIMRMLEILRSHQAEKVEIIEKLLDLKVQKQDAISKPKKAKVVLINPTVFISYSWDNDPHKEWVLRLANRLCSDGINVILDRYFLKPGKNLTHFVEDSISKAQRIIIIFTPNYKLKTDKRTGGVGYEYSILNADLYKNQTANEKVIPVLRAGTQEDSIPAFMHQFIHIDIRNDKNFENSYLDLLREIYNEPEIQKPLLGVKPTFKKYTTEEVERPMLGLRPAYNMIKKNNINPEIIFNEPKKLKLFQRYKKVVLIILAIIIAVGGILDFYSNALNLSKDEGQVICNRKVVNGGTFDLPGMLNWIININGIGGALKYTVTTGENRTVGKLQFEDNNQDLKLPKSKDFTKDNSPYKISCDVN
ncbi:MAG TPA: toll/interleukin-1 receptor domain-containing protein, partial [Saprospiraceae bacterium]|nr:toll/interleukin-1 receptor domain-containing protein [Saprospiraceae bacterium]